MLFSQKTTAKANKLSRSCFFGTIRRINYINCYAVNIVRNIGLATTGIIVVAGSTACVGDQVLKAPVPLKDYGLYAVRPDLPPMVLGAIERDWSKVSANYKRRAGRELDRPIIYVPTTAGPEYVSAYYMEPEDRRVMCMPMPWLLTGGKGERKETIVRELILRGASQTRAQKYANLVDASLARVEQLRVTTDAGGRIRVDLTGDLEGKPAYKEWDFLIAVDKSNRPVTILFRYEEMGGRYALGDYIILSDFGGIVYVGSEDAEGHSPAAKRPRVAQTIRQERHFGPSPSRRGRIQSGGQV